MVSAAAAFDVSKSPLLFSDAGVKFNNEVYVEMLDEKVLPWVTETFDDRYTFIQDGSPANTFNLTQRCKGHFSGFWDKMMWPLSSANINPMDFAIWSIVKSNVSARSYSNVSDLKKALLSSWIKLDEEVVRRTCNSVTTRHSEM
ncbi:uncharacterized protein LOC115229425 [Octopus sinensis]|uniref:Uncharacterized protein LOC115229425 n=1 Tax=Octopus sinensis TaxID=2607531 RepID=A0A6P7TTM0_9MOLL|nr:uncharacterized protein LOC115229425 [Octopus sinensis]